MGLLEFWGEVLGVGSYPEEGSEQQDFLHRGQAMNMTNWLVAEHGRVCPQSQHLGS